MLKSKLEKFVAKKVLFLIVILSIIDITLIGQRWHVLAGLVVGGIFSLLRFSFMSLSLSKLLSNPDNHIALKRSVFKYVLKQLIVVIILASSLIISQWLFAGVVAGILLVPTVVFINSITEGLGITHNNFE